MRYPCFLFAAVILLFSCSPYRGLRKAAYSPEGSQAVLQMLFPKNYRTEDTKDIHGNPVRLFHYSGKAFLFAMKAPDSTTTYLPIDKAFHIREPNPGGGEFYKGQLADGLFYREVRNNGFLYGYFGVSLDREAKFDSAVNSVKIVR